MKRLQHITGGLTHAMRVMIYALLMGAFIFMLSFNNSALLNPSRTMAITYSTFAVTLFLFTRIYGGYAVGRLKSKPIINQMIVAVIFTDIITYVQLQIMNVNEKKYSRLRLFGGDFTCLLMAMAIQIALIVVFAYLGNYVYFKSRPPLKCLVVTDSDASADIIIPKLNNLRLQFTVNERALYTDANLNDKIKRNEAIFLFRLPPDAHQSIIIYCYKHNKDIFFDMNIADILAHNGKSFMLDDTLMNEHTRDGLTLSQRFIKRTFDIIASFLGLVIFSPLMIVCAVIIRTEDGGPVFYRQRRMTRGENSFTIVKFRTMRVDDKEQPQHSVTVDDDRITNCGRWMRRFRIDELPQLFNILKGDMSMVGPRPEMLENVEKYTRDMPEFSYRSRVKAGLTGYAQISGKYNTMPREKLMMDIAYIENYSFMLDLKLLFRTLMVYFQPDESTEAFTEEPADDHTDIA